MWVSLKTGFPGQVSDGLGDFRIALKGPGGEEEFVDGSIKDGGGWVQKSDSIPVRYG